jgi:hypothetical protein
MRGARISFGAAVLAATSYALVVACGSDSDSSTSGSPDGGADSPGGGEGGGEAGADGSPHAPLDPATQKSIATQLASAKCDQASSCGGYPLLPNDGYRPQGNMWNGQDSIKASAALCNAENEPTFENGLVARINDAIAQGTIVYHPDKLAACLDAIRKECLSDDVLPSACRDAFEGTSSVGDACRMDYVCAGGNVCAYSDSDHCDGHCAVPAKAAEPCYNGSGCADGLICPTSGGLCTLRPGEGETCSVPGTPCKGFLVCPSATPQVCRKFSDVATAGVGAGCDLVKLPWCQPGLSCAYQITAPDGGAVSGMSCLDKYPSGAACKTGFVDPCQDDEYCEISSAFSGTCTKRRAVGATCTLHQACASGVVCYGASSNSSGVCTELKANGEKCIGGQQCWSGYCKGVCVVEDPSCK